MQPWRSRSHQLESSCTPLRNQALRRGAGALRGGFFIVVRRGFDFRGHIRRAIPPTRQYFGVGTGQRQLHPQVLELLELCQRRQVVQFLQAEIVEKFARGTQQFRLARDIAVTDHSDPVALVQGLDDVRD